MEAIIFRALMDPQRTECDTYHPHLSLCAGRAVSCG